MNEQLQATINEMLEKSLSAFESGAEWMAGEVPDLISQLLTWSLAENAMYLIISAALMIGYALSIKPLKKLVDDAPYDSDTDVLGFLYFIAGAIATIISIFVFFECIFDIVKMLIAPKLWLLEYAANLIN